MVATRLTPGAPAGAGTTTAARNIANGPQTSRKTTKDVLCADAASREFVRVSRQRANEYMHIIASAHPALKEWQSVQRATKSLTCSQDPAKQSSSTEASGESCSHSCETRSADLYPVPCETCAKGRTE